ncbi:MAG: hypothetical protein GY924_21345 [Planctomycetaceae bacterium]|nr:hypothetical protein [Planctomycetaceae bacterium]
MNLHVLLFADAPVLSDEVASETLEFLYQILVAYEKQYGQQIQRYQQAYRNRKEAGEFEYLDDFDVDDFNDDIPF